jgi:hypothetical protein
VSISTGRRSEMRPCDGVVLFGRPRRAGSTVNSARACNRHAVDGGEYSNEQHCLGSCAVERDLRAFPRRVLHQILDWGCRRPSSSWSPSHHLSGPVATRCVVLLLFVRTTRHFNLGVATLRAGWGLLRPGVGPLTEVTREPTYGIKAETYFLGNPCNPNTFEQGLTSDFPLFHI